MFDTITLKGGAQVIVDFNETTERKKSLCRSCKMPIVWAVSKATGRYMPICRDGDGWISHFANCIYAKKHRQDDSLDECLQQAKRERWQ